MNRSMGLVIAGGAAPRWAKGAAGSRLGGGGRFVNWYKTGWLRRAAAGIHGTDASAR
jgi:hypothetical protein